MTQVPTQAQILRNAAGAWKMRTLNLAGDKVLLDYEIQAKDQPAGWSLEIPGQPPVAIRLLEISGDSIVAEAGPYPSVFRKNRMVTSRFVLQPHDGRLEGSLTAFYDNPEGPSTVPMRVDGTRAH